MVGSIAVALVISQDQYGLFVNAIIDSYAILGAYYGFGVIFVQMIGLAFAFITLVALTI